MAYVVIPPRPGEQVRIEDGAALLARCADRLVRIAQLSGASATQFAATYQPLLVRWATYLQWLPDVETPGATLVERRLQGAERMLVRRQGLILPFGAEPEQASRDADLWTFTALAWRYCAASAPP